MATETTEAVTLEEYYKDDSVLLAFYQKKLLIRGWQPRMNDMEREYVRRMNPPWYEAGRKQAQRMRDEGEVPHRPAPEAPNPLDGDGSRAFPVSLGVRNS